MKNTLKLAGMLAGVLSLTLIVVSCSPKKSEAPASKRKTPQALRQQKQKHNRKHLNFLK
jgi:hypothetical protein